MQDPQDRPAARDRRPPLPLAPGMRRSGHREGHRRQPPRRGQHPQQQGQRGAGQRRRLQPAACHQLQPRRCAHREGRHDAAGHHTFDHHDQCQRRRAARAAVAGPAGPAPPGGRRRWPASAAAAWPTSGRLRRLPARSSTVAPAPRPPAAAAAGRARRTPHTAPATAASRAASHSAARAPRKAPRGVASPVQALPAVSRKPTITAAAKPNSISCACHSSGGSASGQLAPPQQQRHPQRHRQQREQRRAQVERTETQPQQRPACGGGCGTGRVAQGGWSSDMVGMASAGDAAAVL